MIAKFNRADGVNIGTDVRLSGIKVGTVSRMALDPMTYNAVLTLALESSVKLPDNSSVRITSDGLLGNQYLSIEPGGSQMPIAAGRRDREHARLDRSDWALLGKADVRSSG